MPWITRWHARIDIFMGYMSAIIVMVLMLLASGDVIGRFFFNNPIPSAYEFSEVLLALIIFLAFSYVQYLKGHIAIHIFYDHYSPKVAQIFDILCLLLGVVIFGLIAQQGVVLFISSLDVNEISEGMVPFPITPFKFFLPLGAGLLTLRTFSQLIEKLSELIRGRRENL